MSIIRDTFVQAINSRNSWKEYQKTLRNTSKKDQWKLLPPRKDLRMEATLQMLDVPALCSLYSRTRSVIQGDNEGTSDHAGQHAGPVAQPGCPMSRRPL